MTHEGRDARAATPTPDAFGLVGARVEGRYDVEAAVAEGGFAVVYRARHRTLQKPVALKVLKAPEHLVGSGRAAFLATFEAEATTIARLDHPAIVRVIDFGASAMPDGTQAPWMVLEWLEGTTLDAALAERAGRGRTPTEALALLLPVFEGIAHAHDEGVAHRDVKPANVMLTRDRRGATSTRVLDFGIAKLVDTTAGPTSGRTATQSGFRAFSPQYAAPEQISGTRTGPWTDVHALALVTVEALTGRPPYAQHDATAMFADALSAVRPTPARFGVDVGAWEPVLARALALMGADRYPDAGAFLDALRAALSSPQPGAVPPTRVSVDPVALALAPTISAAPAEPTLAVTVAAAPPFLPSAPPRPTLDRRVVTAAVAFAVVGLGGAWWFAQPMPARPRAAIAAPSPPPIAESPLTAEPPPVAPPIAAEPPPVVAPLPNRADPVARPRHGSSRALARVPPPEPIEMPAPTPAPPPVARSANGTPLLSPEKP
jgi:serine/threonine protein kinase